MQDYTAIVLSAGVGSRMHSDIPKQYMDLDGYPVIYYALRAFEESGVDSVVLVTAPEMIEYCRKNIVEKYGFRKVTAIVGGGAERYLSVYEGLKAAEGEYVLIHDGARPLISEKLISDSIENVKKYRAIVPAIAVKDTIKKINDSNEVLDTPERAYLRAAQTPQCFELNLILDAFDKYNSDTLLEHLPTDDGSLIELYSDANVVITEGDENNLKITTPIDLRIAEMILGDESQ